LADAAAAAAAYLRSLLPADAQLATAAVGTISALSWLWAFGVATGSLVGQTSKSVDIASCFCLMPLRLCPAVADADDCAVLSESDSDVDLFPRQLLAFADAEIWCTHLM